MTTLQEVRRGIEQEPRVLGTACARNAHQTCWLSRSIDGSRNIQFLSSHHEASKRRDIVHECAHSCRLHLQTKVLSNAAITSRVLYVFTAKCDELEGGQGDRKVDKENVLKW